MRWKKNTFNLAGAVAKGATTVTSGILKNGRTTEWGERRRQEMVQEFNIMGGTMGTSPVRNNHFSRVKY